MSKKVIADSVVQFHYDLYSTEGELMESSRDGEVVAILHGHRSVVPGLEAGLKDRSQGERFEVVVQPAQGYGNRVEGLTERVSKKRLQRANRLKVGDRTTLQTDSGHRYVTVLKVGGKMIDLDLNHPMAGKVLRFDVEIVGVRDALPEELAHGHVHGTGGHHH
jgi:FKBP-type peptidyl-prolyl cis-trans isomerase SlyD